MAVPKPLLRAIEVMDVISAHPSGATVMEIARQLDLPKASAYRIVSNLKEAGYLCGGGRHQSYRLGERFLRQSHSAIKTRDILRQVRPVLSHLAGMMDEVVYFNSLSGIEIRNICAEFPRSKSARAMVMPGDVFPINATASGKVLCAFQEPELMSRMIDNVELTSFRPGTIMSKEKLRLELTEVAKKGYGISDDEIDEGVFAISVPVRVEGVGVFYSLGTNGVKSRMLAQRELPDIITLLESSAREIAHMLSDLRQS